MTKTLPNFLLPLLEQSHVALHTSPAASEEDVEALARVLGEPVPDELLALYRSTAAVGICSNSHVLSEEGWHDCLWILSPREIIQRLGSPALQTGLPAGWRLLPFTDEDHYADEIGYGLILAPEYVRGRVLHVDPWRAPVLTGSVFAFRSLGACFESMTERFLHKQGERWDYRPPETAPPSRVTAQHTYRTDPEAAGWLREEFRESTDPAIQRWLARSLAQLDP